MPAFKDLTGQRFTNLVVVSVRRRGNGERPLWLCKCDCGGTKEVLAANLLKGNTRSCGCLHRAQLVERITKHGRSHTALWKTWYDMRERTRNPDCRAYKNYGGRGIRVHDTWLDSFEPFEDYVLTALGPRPVGGTLDRINNDGDYEPGNLRWATRKEQANNTRRAIQAKAKKKAQECSNAIL